MTRILGLALTLLFLGLALSRVNLATFVDELKSINYIWLIPSAICTLLGYVVRTLRWRVILSGAARAPFNTLFPVLIMGFATNNLLPGRLGEFWRAYLLGRKRNVSKTFALASVFVERVFDGLTLIALLGLISVSIQLPGYAREVALASAALFLAATAVVAILLWRPGILLGPSVRAIRPLPPRWSAWIEVRLAAFIDGLSALRSLPVLLTAAGLSLGVWLFEGGSYLLLSRGVSLGLPSTLELPGIGLALVTINLGIMVPSGPGYVGTQEFFGTTALGLVGANPQTALALVVVSHAVQYLLVTALGLVFFAREQLWPSSLRPALVEEPAR